MKYAIGIDLGTTHCALSYLPLSAKEGRGGQQAVLAVPQLTAPGTVEARPLLPSFLYLASQEEFPPGALSLPWDSGASGAAVGELARSHGAKVPGRLVASAKSWLCHPTADRRAPLLPWQAAEDVSKVSPVAATAQYLSHLAHAWNAGPFADSPLADQEVVVTVPASFDVAARDLTLEATAAAGLPRVTLLEEPQAALYAYLEAQGEAFRKLVRPGDVILVVDVGGGTTDFSLIRVDDEDGNLALTRLAVGDHILLGGDNMDLALAYSMRAALEGKGRTLDSWQLTALTYACRSAKERLYCEPALKEAPVVIPGRSSALIGGTLKSTLSRAALDRVLSEGFFPLAMVTDEPVVARRSGLAQVGLPYAQDAAVTRHLAAFLCRQAKSLGLGSRFARPTAVLFNGGVFKASALRQRVVDVVDAWLGEEGAAPVRELPGTELDLAVARGGAYYGWVKHGHGLRIRGGTARSYYVGVETAMPAVPGYSPPVRALCVAPFGMEEGSQADLPTLDFGLVVGEPTQFRFFSSSTRREDTVGEGLDDAEHQSELEELPPIETTMPAAQGHPAGRLVPVSLSARVTELGRLELSCLEREGAGRWKLELNVRPKDESPAAASRVS